MSDPQQFSNQHRVPPYVSQQPQRHGSQPQQQPHASQGYVLNGQSSGPAAPNTGAPTNSTGRAGLIIGLVAIALSIATTVAVQVAIRSDGYMLVSFVSGIGSLLAFASGLAALILGLIGLRRPGLPHAAAGIATGIGIAQVVGIASSYLINTFGALLHF